MPEPKAPPLLTDRPGLVGVLDQWPASCQVRPTPTDTSSGTAAVGSCGHLAPDQLLDDVALPGRHLEHQLVVHLQQHPGRSPSAP